ncbi:hypothetical protein [Guptibacillus hwajinpoensis]|uniref:Uncharacterized protein n=1 Tax=Guptibacillus hwajinpoensis TaxID=208199 RepID=A0A0J6CXL8_9BACL|nr:hypothetical protein [Alkalihalobacillus macyae]KMM36799.1 hypothetical protein AB986_12805 [Alkalihalobacillus macyae]
MKWNSDTQTLNVEAGDYNKLKQDYDLLQKGARALYKSYEYETRGRNPTKWRYYGDGVFEGFPYTSRPKGFTIGNYYSVREDATAGTTYYFITNDFGEEVMYSLSNQEKLMITSQYT